MADFGILSKKYLKQISILGTNDYQKKIEPCLLYQHLKFDIKILPLHFSDFLLVGT